MGPKYKELPGTGPNVQGDHVLTKSRDGQWLVSIASLSGPPDFLFHNREYSCIHCNPAGRSPRGETTRVKQRVYLLKGAPEDLVKRYEHDRKEDVSGEK